MESSPPIQPHDETAKRFTQVRRLFDALLNRTKSRTAPELHPAVVKHSEFESVLLTVWRQSLVENSPHVTVAGRTFPVRSVTRHKLKEVYFRFEGHEFRGSEPYPDPESPSAATEGKVMQFVERGYKVGWVNKERVCNSLYVEHLFNSGESEAARAYLSRIADRITPIDTDTKYVATFRKIFDERVERLGKLTEEELRKLAADPLEQLTVESHMGTIEVMVESTPKGKVAVVIRGLIEEGKYTLLEGLYKHPDGIIRTMSKTELAEWLVAHFD